MKDKDTVSVLTAQLVSQLMYCSSRLQQEETNKIIKEISSLLCSYRKKIKNLGK
tara:strand:+ start:2627 stop:2788 length:162 start_codon:yes stop_codon:yes gene_type:complete